MTIWPWAMVGLAVFAFVVVPAWGLIRFRPSRARSVRFAEHNHANEVMQHVLHVAPAHPEIVRTARMDRHPFYLYIHIAVFGYATSIFLGATPTSNVIALGMGTRMTMATCYLIGATLVITGSAMGTKILGHHFMPRVRDHVTAAVLGDDVVLPYRVGSAGMFAVLVSMFIYTSTSFRSTAGSLGGWMTGACFVACIHLIVLLHIRTQTWERNDAILIADALALVDLADDDAE